MSTHALLLLLQSSTPTVSDATASQPVRRRALAAAVVAASGLFWCPQPTPTVTVEKWGQPLSQPTLRRGLPASEQQALAYAKASPFAESVTVGRWLQPLAEPVRAQRRLNTGGQQSVAYTPFIPAPVSGSDVRSSSGPIFGRTIIVQSRFAPVSVPAEVVTADKWFAELSSPQRQRIGLAARHQQAVVFVEAAPFQEAVSLDRWLLPLAEPVRVRPRLGTGAQQAAAYVEADPFPESTDAGKWFAPLSEPIVKTRPGLHASRQLHVAFAPSEDVTVAKWLAPLAEPVRAKPRVQPGAYVPYVAPTSEVVTLDKWFFEFSTPQRPRLGLAARQQQTTAFTQAAPFAEAVSIDRWQQPLADPVRVRPRLATPSQQHLAFVKADPFPEATDAGKWFAPFGEPVRARLRLGAGAQQYSSPPTTGDVVIAGSDVRSTSGPIFGRTIIFQSRAAPVFVAEVVTADKWFSSLSTPQRQRFGLAVRQQQAAFTQADTVSWWLAPLSGPVRTWPALRTAAHQHVAWVQGAPFAESVSVDRWLLALSEPQRPRIGLAARLQQATAFWPYPLANLDAPAWACALYPDRAPGRVLATAHQQALAFVKTAPFVETASADRWAQPPSQPTRRLHTIALRLPAGTGSALPLVAGPDRWLQAFVQPAGAKRRTQPDGVWNVALAAEPITADKWFAAWQVPARVQQRPTGFVALAPAVESGVAVWWQPTSQPVLRKAFAQGYQAAFAGPALPYVASPDRWLAAFLEPGRLRIGRQQAGEYASPYVVPVSPDFESVEWLVPLAEPRLRVPSVASWQAFVFNHTPILVLPTPERRTVHARDRDRVIAASGPGRVIVAAVDDRTITPEGRSRTIRARLTDRKIITE